MRIAAISDTHEHHNYIETFPEADVFVHAGDFTMIGEAPWVESFNNWLGKLPYKYKIVIAGNHDRSFDVIAQGHSIEEARSYGANRLPNVTHYLLNSGCEIDGKKFWGSPYTPFFASDYWKFHYDRAQGPEMWAQIPSGLDVLITHGPPLRILDQTIEGDNAGCFDLRNRLYDLLNEEAPKYHVFGHIHEAKGQQEFEPNSTVCINASAVDRRYKPRKEPWVVFDV